MTRKLLEGLGLATLLACWLCACSGATLKRQVELSEKRLLVEGAGRAGTVQIDGVRFVPQAAAGDGREEWPPAAVEAVEQKLSRDLASQPWLGGSVDQGADWRMRMDCRYTPTLEHASAWWLTVPVLGLGLVGGGGGVIASDESTALGSVFIVAGAVAVFAGGFAAYKVFGPPRVEAQKLDCSSVIQDRLGRDFFSGRHDWAHSGREGFATFLEKAELEIFSGLRDELKGPRTGDKRLGAKGGLDVAALTSVAVVDVEAGSFLDQNQKSMVAKLLASEMQRMGVRQVLGVDDVRAVLGFERQKMLVGCNDESCMAELGGALGVKFILAASIGQIGDSFIIDLRLIDVTSFDVAARTTQRAGSMGKVLDLIPQLVAEIVRR